MGIKKSIIYLLKIWVSVLLFSYSCRKDTGVILANAAYAIGQVTDFNNVKSLRSVWYKFNVGMDTITNNSEYHAPLNGVALGDKFIVIYKKDDPRKSIMVFDYPIKDSTDYKKYVIQFSANPPKF